MYFGSQPLLPKAGSWLPLSLSLQVPGFCLHRQEMTTLCTSPCGKTSGPLAGFKELISISGYWLLTLTTKRREILPNWRTFISTEFLCSLRKPVFILTFKYQTPYRYSIEAHGKTLFQQQKRAFAVLSLCGNILWSLNGQIHVLKERNVKRVSMVEEDGGPGSMEMAKRIRATDSLIF